MNTSYLSSIPLSQSDKLLYSWGFDLTQEYFSIAKSIPDNHPFAVELATGTGRMSAVLSGLFPSVITGDISLVDLPRAQQRIPPALSDRVQYLQLDMESLPFRSQSIPVLFCMNTIHEMEHPAACIREMIRIIHPNGYLVVGDFNRLGFDTMQRIHETVYHNNHNEGTMPAEDIGVILQSFFHDLQKIDTQLNRTFIARKKQP
ncbi:MAG: class I SAM-dependent methyltransferase [Bacteroidota bacterium]|jgi:ubiquinone/menaquinone biosynthesis C-methylase UbiE